VGSVRVAGRAGTDDDDDVAVADNGIVENSPGYCTYIKSDGRGFHQCRTLVQIVKLAATAAAAAALLFLE
jgi:hypothetical protein